MSAHLVCATCQEATCVFWLPIMRLPIDACISVLGWHAVPVMAEALTQDFSVVHCCYRRVVPLAAPSCPDN